VLNASNSFWSLGPQLALTLFDGGLRDAQVEAAKASYDQSVANYRQSVLTSFREVEDELAALEILAQQAEVQSGAVTAAREAERLILNQYAAGTVAYTSVITAQTVALSSEQIALGILQNRLSATVSLIGALGGGWDASLLPVAER
jgi:outer membrane protein TolC